MTGFEAAGPCNAYHIYRQRYHQLVRVILPPVIVCHRRSEVLQVFTLLRSTCTIALTGK